MFAFCYLFTLLFHSFSLTSRNKTWTIFIKASNVFENKLREYQTCRKAVKCTYIAGSENAKAVEVSYPVAKSIPQTGKPHTIGEELNLPAAKEMAGVIVGEKAAKFNDICQI